MHFWIDKRSSNLHNYGGGRGRGAGGFYNRTFGRTHHPPPLIRSSSSNNPTHSTNTSTTTTTTNGTSNSSGSQRVQIPLNNSQEAIANHFEMLSNHLRFHDPSGFINSNGGCHHSYLTRGDPAAAAVFGGGGYLHPPPTTGSDPVLGLTAGSNHGYVGVGIPMARRPRSQSHSAAPSAVPNRRRSSSSSSGSTGQQRRASMNRWTYDPYHINQHNRSHASQQPWNDLRNQIALQSSPPIAEAPQNFDLQQQMSMAQQIQNQQSRRLIDSNNSHSHWRDDDPSGSSMPQGTSTSTSQHSIVDPAWARTKRIGLTLCFMAFILLSTVAAKFVIEGPWLLDKQPRHERTEATIYFFLTELIFVVFAMALFFTGITCLRKRTNAYLLRQFNQYIMQTQTSPQGPDTPPDYNGGGQQNPSGGTVPQNVNHQGVPFHHHHHHHFLPLENHLMNMHITVAESSANNFAIGQKPPPYHIALYLPVPDDQGFVTFDKDGHQNGPSPKGNRRISQESADQRQSSSWISSCIAENETDKTEDDETSAEETEPDGIPRRKRQKKTQDDPERSETPPPPYGQI